MNFFTQRSPISGRALLFRSFAGQSPFVIRIRAMCDEYRAIVHKYWAIKMHTRKNILSSTTTFIINISISISALLSDRQVCINPNHKEDGVP
jgi:hypothetical protein